MRGSGVGIMIKRNVLAYATILALITSTISPIRTLANPPWFGQGCGTSYTGPDGIRAGSYPPQSLTQDQRQWLFEVFGHQGIAPDGYGGEDCNNSNQQQTQQPTQQPWFGQGCGTSYTGPGGIRAGSYSPQDLSQDQRQWLFEVFGHAGVAPDGYGGESCSWQTQSQPTSLPIPTQTPAPSHPDWFGQGCGTSYTGPDSIRAGSYSPQDLSQDQRQWLFEVFGHDGVAPVGYGGEPCNWQTQSQPTKQTPTNVPTVPPANTAFPTRAPTPASSAISTPVPSQSSGQVMNCSPNNQKVEYWYTVITWDTCFLGICLPHPHLFYKVTLSSGTPARNTNAEIGPIIVGYNGIQNDWNNYDKGGWQSGYPNAPQLSSNNEYIVRVDYTDTFFDRIFNSITEKLRVCTME
jgi:hypothetical protein